MQGVMEMGVKAKREREKPKKKRIDGIENDIKPM